MERKVRDDNTRQVLCNTAANGTYPNPVASNVPHMSARPAAAEYVRCGAVTGVTDACAAAGCLFSILAVMM